MKLELWNLLNILGGMAPDFIVNVKSISDARRAIIRYCDREQIETCTARLTFEAVTEKRVIPSLGMLIGGEE